MAGKMGGWAIAAVLCLGAGAMMWYSQHDDAKRLQQGEFRRISYEVLGHRSAAGHKLGSRVDVKYADPASGREVLANVPVGAGATAQGEFAVGQRGVGWVHPGYPTPFLTEAQPDFTHQGEFERRAGTILILVGAGLLTFAWKTGRLLG